jgi:hypothetical protein
MELNKSDLIEIRDYLPDDRNFIMATFLRALYHGGSYYSLMHKHKFMGYYENIASAIIDKQTIKVACLKEEPSTIMGYSISIPHKNAITFVFVKQAWRKIGLAKDLVRKDTKYFTHYTTVGLSIAKQKGLRFDPFLLIGEV